MTAIRKIADNNLLQSSSEVDVFKFAKEYGYGELHFKSDEAVGLQAVIAIHNTKRGPSLGGCRFKEYINFTEALLDVMRLAQAMSFKSAIADLPLGGGKSVILKPKHTTIDRQAFFESFGTFINDLNGRYITALDSGTTEEDMNIIARKTKHVASHSQPDGKSGNPAPYTAMGVRRGIEAAIKYKLKRDNFKNIHVVIQGVGQVGYALAKDLHKLGAKLTVCDIDEKAVYRCVNEFRANVISFHEAHKIKCDVFSPSALGGVINNVTLHELNTPIIAGCANNQLSDPRHGKELHQMGILYAPDYLINAGGLIYAASLYLTYLTTELHKKIDAIHDRLLNVFARSEKEKRSTTEIVDEIALKLIN